MHNLLDTLNQLSEELTENFERINLGGCCVVAGYLGLFLRHHVPTRIRVSGYGEVVDLHEVRDNTNNSLDKDDWDCEGVAWYHVVVEFEHEGKLYRVDSDGVQEAEGERFDGRPLYSGDITISEAIAFGRQAWGWNPDFDRDQIPDMRRTITRTFRNHARGAEQRAAA